MKLICTILLLVSFPLIGKPPLFIKRALSASVQIRIKGQGLGSGFAFSRDDKRKRTLIATNDHVCQLTRGLIHLINEVDYDQKLNTYQMKVELADGTAYRARVAYTNNTHKGIKGKDDLCIVEMREKIPLVKLGSNADLGDRVFSVSGPKGHFPLIHAGYVGPLYTEDVSGLTVQTFTLYVSSGSSGGGIFNKKGNVVGVIFAIQPVVESVPIPLLTYGVPVKQLKQFVKTYQEKLNASRK